MNEQQEQEQSKPETPEMQHTYHTPPEALEFIMANPPMPTADGGEPPRMSNAEAAYRLARIAASVKSLTSADVYALHMGAKRMLNRYFHKAEAFARKREAAKGAAE